MDQEVKPLLLATPELVMSYWPQMEPLFAAAPVADDLTMDNVLKALINKDLLAFVFKKDTDVGPEVELAMLLAPAANIMTIVTIAGKNLKENCQKYWEPFKGWCYMNGVRAIDAYVPERMEEFMTNELGLKRKSIHVRLSL